MSEVDAAAPDVCGVLELRAVAADLRDERFGLACCGPYRISRDWKSARCSSAHDDTAFGTYGNGRRLLEVAGAAKKRREANDRIDDEWNRAVVGSYIEPHGVDSSEDESACDVESLAIYQLVGSRSTVSETLRTAISDKIAHRINEDPVCARYLERNFVKRCIRGKNVVVLEFAAPPIVKNVDSAIDVEELDPGEAFDVETPFGGVSASNVVTLAPRR